MTTHATTPRRQAVRFPRGISALLATLVVASACTEYGIAGPVTLPAATVVGQDASASGAVLDVVTGPRNFVGPITNGANHTGSIVAAGQTDSWTFTATAGQYITVAIGELSGTVDFTPWIRVVAPNSTVIGNSWNVAAADIGVAAPQTGTYTLLVATADAGNDATGTYRFSVGILPGTFTVSSGDEGGPMTIGANHTGTLLLGDQDLWSFHAATGDAIILSVGEISGSADFTPWIRLIAPNGAVVGNSWNVAAAQIQVAASQTGTYTVIVGTADSGNDGTGDYRLVLAQSAGTVTVPAGDEGGPLTNGATQTGALPVGDLDQWQFTAAVGDAIIVAVGEVSGDVDFTPWIRVIAPNGAIVGNSWNVAAAQVQVAASVAGTYSVVVSTADAGNDAAGNYTLVLAKSGSAVTVSPGDQGGPLQNGGNAAGSLFTGDLDVYTFNSTQGAPMALSIGEQSGTTDFTPWIRVIAPNGAIIGNSWNVAAAQVTALAPVTGTYTVVVSTADAGNDATGSYILVLQKPGAFITPPGDQGGPMTNGANYVGDIFVGDIDRFTFTANQGDYIAINIGELSGTTDFTPWIRLGSPTGQLLGNSWNVAAATINVVAPATGTYTIVVQTADAGNDASGTYTLTVAKAPGSFVVPPGDDGGAISNGSVNGTITIGDLDMFSFSAVQGAHLAVTIAELTGTTDYTPWIRLVAPNGALVGNAWGASGAAINLVAPQTGTYTILVGTADAGNDATGTYQLMLSGANLTPNPGGTRVATGSR